MTRQTTRCQRKGCDREAMVARMPEGKSSYHIHRDCFPCAAAYYQGTERTIVKAALSCRRQCLIRRAQRRTRR